MINNYLARHKKNKGYPKETSPKQIEDLKKRLDNARAMTGENTKGASKERGRLDLQCVTDTIYMYVGKPDLRYSYSVD